MTFRATVPSTSSLNDFWPESKQLIAVPHNLQRTISAPISAIYIGINILLALCTVSNQTSRNAIYEQQTMWALDICDELWYYFRRWTTGPTKPPLYDETMTIYMQLLEALAIPNNVHRDCALSLRKATLMTIGSVACLVESLAIPSMSECNQLQLALMVTRLYYSTQTEVSRGSLLDRRRQPVRTFDTDALKQSAKRICENSELLSGLQKDLQVCDTRYYWSYC